jgi:hypothetical protein
MLVLLLFFYACDWKGAMAITGGTLSQLGVLPFACKRVYVLFATASLLVFRHLVLSLSHDFDILSVSFFRLFIDCG